MRRTLALLLLAPAAACGRPVATPSPAPAAGAAPAGTSVPSLDAQALRRDLTAFASDSMRGREAGTADAIRAARFLAAELERAGVEPAGDSGYFQRVPMTRQVLAPTSKVQVVERGRATDIPLGMDGVVPLPSLGAGTPLPRLYADGDLVFASYALNELGRDDLANLDLGGKVVVYVHGAPASADSATRARLSDPQAIGERLMRLIARNPAAVIVMVTGKFAGDFAQYAGEMLESVALDDGGEDKRPRLLPMVMFAVPRAGSPLLPAGWPRDDRARPLSGRRFTARLQRSEQRGAGYNVVGIVRGRDAAMRQSYVAYGAHLDHIGVQPPIDGDSIANGADDDGSGSMGLLAVARALARAPAKPRRSTLFVWHTGEEKGLLGSEWFTEHPTVPADSIVAQLNADMIGRNAPDSLYLVGPRAAPNGQSRVLGAVVDSVNAALPRPFAVNREWDSPEHPERIYFRSDHFNYARRGIPIVFFTTGLHEDYHKVSDEVSKIDFDKLTRVAELMLRTGIAIADRESRPRAEVVP